MSVEELESKLGTILQEIEAIKASGIIAPPSTWIQKYQVPKKKGKIYYYYRLMESSERRSRSGSIQGKVKLYLGNETSELYLEYKEAIARRNQLKILQQRHDRLMKEYQIAKRSKADTSIRRSLRDSQTHQAAVNSDLPKNTNSVVEGDLLKAVARIETNQAQIWQVLKAISEKLDVEIPEFNRR